MRKTKGLNSIKNNTTVKVLTDKDNLKIMGGAQCIIGIDIDSM